MKPLQIGMLACAVAVAGWAAMPVPEPSLGPRGYGIKDHLVTLSINWTGNATGTGGSGSGTRDWPSGLAWASYNNMTMLGNSGSFGGNTVGSALYYNGE